jgi:hypothetical protein
VKAAPEVDVNQLMTTVEATGYSATLPRPTHTAAGPEASLGSGVVGGEAH